MEKELKPKIELYDMGGAIIEIEHSYPNVSIYKNLGEYKKPDGEITLFFDEDQTEELKETIQILNKGLEILQK